MKTGMILVSVLLVFGYATPSVLAASSPVEDFYKNTQMNLIISSGAGGGYDRYGRLLARHMGKHIPGNPSIIPRNMPGAGGLKATAHMYANAPKDGATIAIVHNGMTTASLLMPQRAKFREAEFSWIGNIAEETAQCLAWRDSTIKTTADMLSKEFIVGGAGSGSNLDQYPRIINNILGAKIKVISGYKGSKQIALAVERGEVQGICALPLSTITNSKPEWIRDKKIGLLLQMGLTKDPALPHVPLIMDFVKNEEDRMAMELILAPRKLLRPVFAPPSVPTERVMALRAAFMKTVKSNGFMMEAKKQRLIVTPMSGEEAEEIIRKIHEVPRKVLARAIEAMQK